MSADNKDFRVVFFEWRDNESLYKYTLGLHYLTAMLKREGFYVKNMIFEVEAVDYVLGAVLRENPDMVGIHFYPENEDVIFEFVTKLKEKRPDITTVLGGHTATLYAASILKKAPFIDVISYGEGELTTLELCTRLKNKESLKGCLGTFYRENGVIHRNPPRPLIEDLDSLPYPDLSVLIEENKKAKTVFSAVSTSRGCKGNCGFCITNRVFDKQSVKTWRGRSPENVVGEILHMQEVFKEKRLVYRIVDGSFEDPDPIEKTRLTRIIELFEEYDLHIPFGILTRAESWHAKDEELIKRMKKVGLYEVAIGFEGCTDESLRAVSKRATVEDNYRTYELFHRNGLNIFGFLIMFHPYTKFDELRKNAQFLLDMDMGYQTQNWWSELYLWPDSKMLPNIIHDGLLIGPGEKGYEMKYAFVDGRVAKVQKVLHKVGVLNSVLMCRETIEKYKIESCIYGVWKEQYDEFKRIENEIQDYLSYYKKCRTNLGEEQWKLFIEILDTVENDTIDVAEEGIIKRWDELLISNHDEMERQWIRYRMMFGRKKVTLI